MGNSCKDLKRVSIKIALLLWELKCVLIMFLFSVTLIDVKKVVVAVTDGFSSRGIEITKELTDQLKTSKVQFFSVGTSHRVNKPELNNLSSKPSGTHQLIVDLKKDHFTKSQVEQLAKRICKNE